MNFINTWIAKLIAGLGVIISALLFWRNIKSGIEEDKENEIKAEHGEEVLDNVLKSTKAKEDAENLSEDEINDSLRANGWMRDD